MGVQRHPNAVGPEASAQEEEEAAVTVTAGERKEEEEAVMMTGASDAAALISGNRSAESYEEQHVHSVYERIAPHFSSTRHKPWPLVTSFLTSLPPGSVGVDVGCGNGKYLRENGDVFIVGADRSANLVSLARERVNRGGGDGGVGKGGGAADVAVADGLALPVRAHAVDFAISVAVVHHLSTRARRVEAVRALFDCVRRGGKVLVYVWALEQGGSRRGWSEGDDPDQLVPWVMKATTSKKNKGNGGDAAGSSGDTTYQRYYHLYRKGELEEDVVAAGGRVLVSGYEKDNWWVIGARDEDASSSSSR
ncbi:S-adenosyl-L-methionine-dependent methyltransferase [Whalleya microplaca]|nr:S-adenosyl-L-methionine-dependent methyltransferase [Whalleya microplaca]